MQITVALSDELGRNAAHNMVWWNVLGHDSPGRDNSAIANVHAGQDHDVRTAVGVIVDNDRAARDIEGGAIGVVLQGIDCRLLV